jgi:hypothetical protein
MAIERHGFGPILRRRIRRRATRSADSGRQGQEAACSSARSSAAHLDAISIGQLKRIAMLAETSSIAPAPHRPTAADAVWPIRASIDDASFSHSCWNLRAEDADAMRFSCACPVLR